MTDYPWSKDELQVIKAAWATDQGRAALTVVIEGLCGLNRDSFDDSALRMARLAGRRSVAVDLAIAIKTPIDKLVKEHDEPRSIRSRTATERSSRTTGRNSG